MTRLLALAVVAGLAAGTSVARADGESAIEDILGVLEDRGLIDETQHDTLLSKHYRSEAERVGSPDVAAGEHPWHWSGDARVRYEWFRFQSNAAGPPRDPRYRFRYRIRFGFWKQINDWVKVSMRLASGEGGPNSTNQTFGGSAADFDPDPIFINEMWVEAKLPDCGCGLASSFTAGKVKNPFLWKNGKGDFFTWDSDFSPEGAFLKSTWSPVEGLDLTGIVGGFIVDEDSSEADPKLFATQIRAESAMDGIEFGGKLSLYEWRSLGADGFSFIGRATAQGNLNSAFDQRARIGDAQLYVRFPGENWPVLLYGVYTRNFAADRALIAGFPLDEEDSGYGIGGEIGSAKKLFLFGAGFFRLEANATVGQFTDSDLFDGFTNREGFMLYVKKRIFENTEVKLEFFESDELKNTGGGLGPFSTSITNANRQRGRADFVVKF